MWISPLKTYDGDVSCGPGWYYRGDRQIVSDGNGYGCGVGMRSGDGYHDEDWTGKGFGLWGGGGIGDSVTWPSCILAAAMTEESCMVAAAVQVVS